MATSRPISFQSIPLEIRLRILNHTHLGCAESGGYDAKFERLRICGGKIIPRCHPILGPDESDLCQSPSTHNTATPQCKCRILPVQLFLVNKQIYREAVEVLYSNICFEFYDTDLRATLSFLRNLPRDGLSRLRRIEFSITEAQCEGWCDGSVASGYYAATLEQQIAIPFWGGGAPPALDYKADWRAVLAFLASAHAELARLTIFVDMAEGPWAWVEDTSTWEPLPELSMFRFIYDLFIDVTTALCSLRGLGAVEFDLAVFNQLEPWLEREVMGYSRERTKFKSAHEERVWNETWHRPQWYQVLPPWHDPDQRLEGSNYVPDIWKSRR